MPDKNSLANDLKIAINIAKEAGAYLFKAQQGAVNINSSEGKDIKLEADVVSEKLIVDKLASLTPHDILSEESGLVKQQNPGGLRWIVDPLDGSLNFLRGIDINGVSIGLWKNDTPVLGVVFDFIHNLLYTGVVEEKVALCNGQEISVSSVMEKKDSIVATGFPVYSAFDKKTLDDFVTDIQQYKKVRLFGSAALSLVHVAKGSVEAYKENNIAIWDVAAGLAIVLAAGGKAVVTPGKGINYLNVYASNGQ